MKQFSFALKAGLLAAFLAFSPALAENCDGIVSSDPARMYDFKHGVWEIDWRIKTASGGIYETTAKSRAYSVLGGDIMIDEMEAETFKGITFRTYNPETESWVVRWQPANEEFNHPLTSRLENCIPVERHTLTQADGTELVVVTRFTDITENSYKLRQNRSADGGKTWIKDTLYFEAKRKEPKVE